MIYEPEEDSYLLEKYVKKYAKGKVLDVGTGSGIQALVALENTKDVLAVDINPEAVDFVKKKGVNAKISDLFSNVEGKFDVIIFNPPYLPEDSEEDEESKKITTGGKKGHEILEKFLKEAKEHLNENGMILIVVSSLTGDVQSLFKKYKYRFECLEIEKMFFEQLYVYLIE
jgi:release factor glutamine methyltransferase